MRHGRSMKRKMKSFEIANAVRKKIKQANLVAGSPVMSTTQLASHYNVCLMTAHKALNYLEEQGLITRHRGSGSFVRELHVPEKVLNIGCAMDMDASAFSIRRKNLIGVFGETSLDYLKKHHCNCRPIPFLVFQDPEYWKGLDGVMISSNYVLPETMDFIRSLPIPTVIFQSEFQYDLPVNQVVPDHSIAMHEIFRRATPKEYRAVTIVYTPHPNGRVRCNAFREGAQEAGFKESQIELYDIKTEEGYRLGCTLSKDCAGKLICCCSDLTTFSIMDALHDNGLRCPYDFEIIGCDNLEGTGILPYGKPVVTAIGYPRARMAATAARLLISNISAGNRLKSYQIIKMPAELILRESALSRN